MTARPESMPGWLLALASLELHGSAPRDCESLHGAYSSLLHHLFADFKDLESTENSQSRATALERMDYQ